MGGTIGGIMIIRAPQVPIIGIATAIAGSRAQARPIRILRVRVGSESILVSSEVMCVHSGIMSIICSLEHDYCSLFHLCSSSADQRGSPVRAYRRVPCVNAYTQVIPSPRSRSLSFSPWIGGFSRGAPDQRGSPVRAYRRVPCVNAYTQTILGEFPAIPNISIDAFLR